MRYLILLIVLTIGCAPLRPVATVSVQHLTYSSSEDVVDNGTGIKATVKHKDLYLWGSAESAKFRFGGQGFGSAKVYGTGVGLSKPVLDGISLWFDAGYYWGQHDKEGQSLTSFNDRDPLITYMNQHVSYSYGPVEWDRYEYELNDNWGGSAGISFDHAWKCGIGVAASVGYRYLRLPEYMAGHPGPGHAFYGLGWWELYNNRNLSAVQSSLTVSYNF